MQIPRQKIIILGGGVFLGILAVIMTFTYISKQRQIIARQAKEAIANIQANQAAVLVAKADIPKGVVVEADMLETAVVPNKYKQPQAVSSLDRISGMVATAPISKGEQVTLSKLVYPREAGRGGLAASTPFGKRAVTISADNIATLAGMINPGDYVDVIAMLPIPVQTAEGKQAAQVAAIPLFQNVLVLAVGQDMGGPAVAESGRYKKEEKKEASPLITLALSPQEANLISFVQEQGKTRLILRSPADSQIEVIQPASWDALFQYIMPKTEDPREEPVQEGQYIEIYRGMNKERIPLSSR